MLNPAELSNQLIRASSCTSCETVVLDDCSQKSTMLSLGQEMPRVFLFLASSSVTQVIQLALVGRCVIPGRPRGPV